jgi:hypothetical protein
MSKTNRKNNSHVKNESVERQIEDRRKPRQPDASRCVALFVTVFAEVLVVAVQHLFAQVIFKAVEKSLFPLEIKLKFLVASSFIFFVENKHFL